MPGQGFRRLVTVVAVGAIAGAGCIGARSSSELEQLVRSRGGGVSEGLVVDAIDAVGDAQGTATVGLVNVTAMNNRVTLQARVPREPQEYDVYTYGTGGLYGGNGLSGPSPGSRSAGGPPIEAQWFGTGDVALDRLDDMIDQALADVGFASAYVERLVIARPAAGEAVTVTIRVTNDRQTADAVFAADGTLVELDPA